MNREYYYLFKDLDTYIEETHPQIIRTSIVCCRNKNIQLSDSLLRYVCINCGVVANQPYTKDMFDKYKNPLFVKTLIPYRPNTRHLTRLNKWSNYSYKEVVLDKNLKYIDSKLGHLNREILLFSKVLFKELFPNLKIRSKIRDSLIVYCYYSTALSFNRSIEIDDLLKIFKISIKNYNDLNKKIVGNKLYYFEGLNDYLNETNLYEKKNQIIKLYNLFLSNSTKRFMKKSIILGLIYKMVKDTDIKRRFFKIFDINKGSIKNITKYINEYNIIS